jgi:ribosome modulation factor
MNAELRRHMTADERRKHAQLCRLNHAHGFIAREQGSGREACPEDLDADMRAHWLSGWHDADQQIDTRREQ